ncbi:hypothetical protein [Fretibacter rubidus]|uniref:hypothetical protein n=1 Tax=Fretibacter rubidus TaxID=570162 RepID=UPI00352A8896
MLKSKKLNQLTQIAKIRELEKTLAEQELRDAKHSEADCDDVRMKAVEAVTTAQKIWEDNVLDRTIICEHLKYYSDDLVANIEKSTQATDAYEDAVKVSENKLSAFQVCQIITEKMDEMQRNMRRSIQRDKDERAVNAFEERFSYDWVQK